METPAVIHDTGLDRHEVDQIIPIELHEQIHSRLLMLILVSDYVIPDITILWLEMAFPVCRVMVGVMDESALGLQTV